jgi:hypothetical protein
VRERPRGVNERGGRESSAPHLAWCRDEPPRCVPARPLGPPHRHRAVRQRHRVAVRHQSAAAGALLYLAPTGWPGRRLTSGEGGGEGSLSRPFPLFLHCPWRSCSCYQVQRGRSMARSPPCSVWPRCRGYRAPEGDIRTRWRQVTLAAHTLMSEATVGISAVREL